MIKVTTQLVQRQVISLSMQRSFELLLLPLRELITEVNMELQSNPLLEVNEEAQSSSEAQNDQEILREIENRQDTWAASFSGNVSDDEFFEDIPIEKKIGLEDKLLQDLKSELFDPREIKVGEFIIGSLNEDGFLTVDCDQIAHMCCGGDLSMVERVLKVIQGLEPAGIAARDLKECLLIQLKNKGNYTDIDPVYKIINDYLDNLGNKRFSEIARALGISIDEVKKSARLIASFEPRPARNYRPIQPNIYIKPDIYIIKDGESDYQICVNKDKLVPLRVNTIYKDMLSRKNLNSQERAFIREKLKSALEFMKSIAQRHQTVYKISKYILEKQRGFFDNGYKDLAPMTLKELAVALDYNESTISRAISKKYIDTPKGLYPLKFFFSRAIPKKNDKCVASRSIKEEIKDLIDLEDSSSPLSDQNLQEYFAEKGTQIARRTISKYRHTLRISPSHLRKV